MLGGRPGDGADVKASRVEASEIDVARVADGSQNLEVIDRFEEAGFAVTVVPNQRYAFGGQLEIDALEVPEVANGDALQPDRRVAGPA